MLQKLYIATVLLFIQVHAASALCFFPAPWQAPQTSSYFLHASYAKKGFLIATAVGSVFALRIWRSSYHRSLLNQHTPKDDQERPAQLPSHTIDASLHKEPHYVQDLRMNQ